MNAITDPESTSTMCGACGEVYAFAAHAEDCCEPRAYSSRTVIAGALILLSVIFTFVLLPLL
jgi:hypothetical protein